MSVVLATGGYDNTVRLWDASLGVCAKSFAHPEKQVNALAISADKGSLVAGGNPLVRLYDVGAKGGDALVAFKGHAGNVTAVGFDRAGSFIFSGSEDGTVKVWDPRAGGGAVRDFDARGGVNAAVLHPNQGEIVSGAHTGAIRTWDLGAAKCSHELLPEGDTPIASVAIAADASLLAAANFNGSCFLWAPGGEEYVPVRKLRAHKAYVTAARFSPDARYLATTSSDRTLKLWHTADFSLAATLAGHARWVWDCAFSADSAFVVTASSDLTARLWDIAAGDVVRTYAGHAKAVTAVALNDGAGA